MVNFKGIYRFYSPVCLDIRQFATHILFLLMILCLNAQPVFGNQADVVRSLVIKGNHSFSKEEIQNLMQTSVGKPFDAEMLKKDSEKVARFFHNKGIIYARVTESPKKFEDGVYISIEIDEGTIDTITLSGNTKTKDNVILRELLFQKGDIYVEADKKESERILRQKRYIGAAKIEPRWDAESESVAIHVTVTELFSITGAIDPGINNQSGYFLAQVREANIFGSGQAGQIRYERITEAGEKTRGLFTWKYRMPRLVNSHWNFDSEYVQKREGDSWRVLLERPQYTLKSRWSASFSTSELINEVRWYENGEKTDIFEQTLHKTSANISQYFGDRHHQNYLGFWFDSHQTTYLPIESIRVSEASPSNRNIKRVGITVGRRNVGFHQTRFLRGMGGEEDFLSGSQFSTSFGYASPLYGSERTEYYTILGVNGGFVNQNRFFGTALITLSTSFTNQIERSVLQARTALFFRDVFNTGDIYRVDTGFRENGLFDLQQTFVAQFKTEMQFGWRGESQVTLGAANGLRGYGLRQFNGEKMMVLSLESRTVCGGDFFRKMNEGLTTVATFFAKPFIKDRVVDLGLVLSATAFTDIGYIWDSYNTFDIKEVKPSVGFGLRGSVSQVSDAGIFRIELAFPLRPPLRSQIFYGVERAF